MNKDKILKELSFKAMRSSGPGGQHVNKVASKVELSFNFANSEGLTPQEKERIQKNWANRLTKENFLLLQCDEARSQHKNRALIVERFFKLLKEALHVRKKRKATRPTKSSKEKRLKSKRKSAEKKSNRKKPDLD